MEEALDQAVIQGDEEAIKKWRQSTEMFREYFNKYEGKKGAKRIIADIANGSTSADEASAKIFGKKNFGGTAKAASLAREIKDLVGMDSPEWQSLRQEAFTRILKEAPDGRVGVKFSTNLERVLREDGPAMREFFDADEILAMRRLARVVKSVNARPTGLSNPSQSGLMNEFMSRIGKGQIASLAQSFPPVRAVINSISNTSNAKKIDRLVNRATPEK